MHRTVGALSIIGVVACGTTPVSPGDGSSGADPASTSTTVEPGSPSDGADDGTNAGGDTTADEASSSSSSGPARDDTTGELPRCDADEDGHLAGACGGDDCDDADPIVHPGAIDDGRWTIEAIADATQTSFGTDLAVGRDGTPQLVWTAALVATHATRAEGGWTLDAIHDDAAGPIALALDARDEPQVILLRHGDIALLHTARDRAGMWAVEVVDTEVDDDNDVLLDRNGALHVSHHAKGPTAGGPSDLRYATNASGAWAVQTVDADGDTGWSPTLGLADDGTLHFAYVRWRPDLPEDARRELRYATGDGDGPWTTETIDSAFEIDELSIALDANDSVVIGYYLDPNDLVHGALALAVEGDAGLAPVPVLGHDLPRYWPAMTLDAQGTVHFSHIADWSDGLVHVSDETGTFIATDVAPNASGVTSIVATTNAVHVAFWAGPAWTLSYAARGLPNGIDDDCDGTAW